MITPGIVTFDPAQFVTAYPSFQTVPVTALENNFNTAVLQLNNSYCSVVQDEPTRAQLLNLLTAHITALLNGVNGQPPGGLVGRINSATEGSVSVQTDWTTNQSYAQAYFSQTPWGATFWQMTARFRAGRYIAPCFNYPGYGDAWNAWPQ